MRKILVLIVVFSLSVVVFAASMQVVPPKVPSEVKALASSKLIAIVPNKIITVTMNKPNGSEYKPKEIIWFKVKTAVSGYLYILDIPSSGKITQLFPNYYQKNNFVKAGLHKIPSSSKYRFRVSGTKSGIELVEFILSTRPLHFLNNATTTKKLPFAVVGETGKKEFVKFKLKLMKSIVPISKKWTAWTYFYLSVGKKTFLKVQTTPEGAKLTVDGKIYGFTPKLIGVTPGYHLLSLSANGYRTWKGTVFVGVGQTRLLDIKLVPIQQVVNGTLEINVSPASAYVYVDGENVGTGNQVLTVSPGYHTVVVKRDGYQTYYNNSVVVNAGLTTTLNVQLIPLTANIYIHSQPYVKIYIDGVFAGGTGYDGYLYLTGVKVGYHSIKFEKSWYISQTISYRVNPGDNYLSVELSAAGMLKVNSNVYPIFIKIDGQNYGEIANSLRGIYVPVGSHVVTFSNPEYVSYQKALSFAFQRTTETSVYLKLKPLRFSVRASPNPFSPNGDWYQDTTTFYMTLSRRAVVTIKIYSASNVIWYRKLNASYGTTNVTWDGRSIQGQYMPNGIYKVEFTVESYGQTLTKTLNVVINKNGYTYLKEIVIIGGLALIVGLIYLLFLK